MGVHLRGRGLTEGWRDGKKLLAVYGGDRIIWDGRVSQFLTMPAAHGQTAVPQVSLTASSTLEAPRLPGWAAIVGEGTVAGSVGLTPGTATADAAAAAPTLSVGSTLAAPTVTADGDATQVAETITRDEALLFMPTATATVAAPMPSLTVSSTLEAPVAASSGETKHGTYLVSAILDVPTAIVYPPTTAETPSLSAWHRITVSGPALANASSWLPSVSAGHVIAAPTATATGVTPVPQVEAQHFTRQRMNKTTDTQHSSAMTTNPVPGFVSDATYPSTVTGGTTLVIAGSGPATVTASVTGQRAVSGSPTATLYRNGASLGTATFNSTTAQTVPITWSGTVAEGDTLTLGWTTTTLYKSTMLAGTYIEVAPT